MAHSFLDEMTRLFFVLDPPVDGDESVSIQFIAPTANEGVSSIARQFALISARHMEGKVLLLDMSLSRQSQYNSLLEPENRSWFGEVGPASHVMDESKAMHRRFSSVWLHNQDTPKAEQATPLVTFHQVGDEHLFVTRINEDYLERYGKPRINTSRNFWSSLSKAFQMIIIDSPPIGESYDGLAVCKLFDASILVLSAESTRRPVAKNLRDRILDSEGHVAGVVFNRRKMHIPRFVYKLL